MGSGTKNSLKHRYSAFSSICVCEEVLQARSGQNHKRQAFEIQFHVMALGTNVLAVRKGQQEKDRGLGTEWIEDDQVDSCTAEDTMRICI